ncbi:MAG: sulfatase-like hydrolase/transferase [Bacteroidota bacterium]
MCPKFSLSLTYLILPLLLFGVWSCTSPEPASPPPNVILLLADDLGWGDTGFQGHPHIQTPALDQLASNGLIMERFYAAAPVCSPTRGSCLTGRHPDRYGIFTANVGHLPAEELTLAEVLQAEGYATGFFGKWHLGTLTTEVQDANRGGRPEHAAHFNPPREHGFEVSFATESKVPTWNPMLTPEKAAGGVGNQGLGQPFGTRYWDTNGQIVEENLTGDDSRVIMDRALPFIQQSVEAGKPFLAVIWFHAPHTPVVGGSELLAQYAHLPEEQQHYYSCITALDQQVGRLNRELQSLGVSANTLQFFASDNGPENDRNRPRSLGITAGLSERKRSLKEGGIRVPGIAHFPAKIAPNSRTTTPFSTSDYLPTVLDLLDLQPDLPAPLDGESMLPFLESPTLARTSPIGFHFRQQSALIAGNYKLFQAHPDSSFQLFDLATDPGEQLNLALQEEELQDSLRKSLVAWRAGLEE